MGESATLECAKTDAGDAGGNRHVGQTSVLERPIPDARHRQVIDLVRNDNIPAGSRVFGNGDHTVFDHAVVVLNLEKCRPAGEFLDPAGGSRQIIDVRLVGSGEHGRIRSIAGRVAFEMDADQAGAA